MSNSLLTIIRTGTVTDRNIFPDLKQGAIGLPSVTRQPCHAPECTKCAEVCPTQAVSVINGSLALDRGLCLGCNACVQVCPSGTLTSDRSVRTAVLHREDLVLGQKVQAKSSRLGRCLPFRRSLHVREVSTGDSASDAEVSASTSAVFDVSRFGISFVASPRFADALLVTGPVARAMHEPLRRCFDAMSEPRLVIAAGTSAISGGVHRGGYAGAEGVDNILPVAAYIPGDPPHPWSIIHGLLLAMGHVIVTPKPDGIPE